MKQLFGVVLGSTVLLLGTLPCFAQANNSSLFLSVPAKQVQEGDRISVDVKVKSTVQSINAVSGSIIFPESLVKVIGVSRDKTIINLWTREPVTQRNRILFEGIVLNPGFQGSSGDIFRVTFEAKRAGTVTLSFTDGAVLANDGLGSNIVSTLVPGSFRIVSAGAFVPIAANYPSGHVPALPVITEYSASVGATGSAFVKGKGEPHALTKIVFKDTSFKSVGEQFIAFLQTKRRRLDEVLVENSDKGEFQYNSPAKLVAGAYNATPYLVDTDTQTERAGLGVQLLVSDSRLVRILVVAINVLALLIPVVGLGVVIYFIPWYSFRRMRVLRRKLGLEEEQIVMSQNQLRRQDKILDSTVEHAVHSGSATSPAISLVPPFPQRPFPTQDQKT